MEEAGACGVEKEETTGIRGERKREKEEERKVEDWTVKIRWGARNEET